MILRVSKYILLLIVVGCSSNVVKHEKNNDEQNKGIIIDVSQLAQQKFIEGSLFEIKGQTQEAIEKYLDALKYDQKPGIYFTLAKNYYKINKLSSALEYSRQSVKLEPENIDYQYLLASIYNSSHLEDSSAAVYEKIISLDSTQVNAYFQLGMIYEKKRPTYSLELYKKVIENIGPEWNVLVRLVDLNERMGNVNETVKTLEEILKLNPSDLRLQKMLIESYFKNKQTEKAHVLIDDALTSFPDDLTLIEMKGSALLENEKWSDAFEEYKKLIRSSDINYEGKIKVGTLFLSLVEKDSINLNYAKEIFEELNGDTTDWQVNAYLGEIEIRKNNDSAAVQYFKNAIKLAEWNSQLWIRLGGLLFDNKKYTQAIDFMNDAAEKFPNDFAINLIYGLSLSQENNHINAKTYLQRALKINPSDVTVLSAYGFTLNQLKENEEALVYLNKALVLNPDDVQLLGMTALIYDSQEYFVMSDSLYEKALNLDSTNALILNNYSYSLAERGARLEEALKMSKIAVEAEPKNASYLDTIGWIYFMMGDFKRAKDYIENSLKYDSKSATVIDHLGDIFFKLHNKQKALELWKKALELEPDNKKFIDKIEKGVL